MIPVRTRRLLLWVALPALLLVLLYAVVGFAIVPRLIRSGAHDFVNKNYHREVAIGDVRFNPFTLKLDIRDFSLPDADGQPMLSFSHLLVDLTVASVWHLGPDFESIVLERPYTRVLIRPDGTLNLADLALPPSPDKKPEPNPKPLRLIIQHFSIQNGNIAFDDRAHPSAFRTELKPINFDLRNFATVGRADGTYALNGMTEAGERFSWSGSLSPLPLSSHGQFEVGNLQAQTIWSYLRDSVHFELPSGVISISGEYDCTTATNPIGLSVNVHNVTVSDLGIRPKGSTEDYVKLARLEVKDTRADVAKRTVNVGSVHLAGAQVRAWVNSPAAVNLLELVGPADVPGPPNGQNGAGSPSGAGTASSSDNSPQILAGPPAGASPWVVSVPEIALDDLKISAEDRRVKPTVSVQLDELNVHVTGFTTARNTPIAATMSTKINHGGKFDAKADLSPDFATAKAQAELTSLDLTVLQPYISQRTAMTLRNGLLSTKLNIERGGDGHLAVAGELEVAKFRTVDNALKQDFIKVERLQLSGIDYQANLTDTSKPASLHIHNIAARAPYARVIIEVDRSVNVARVLSGPGGGKPPAVSDQKAAPGGDKAVKTSTHGPDSGSTAAAATAATEKSASSDSAAATSEPASSGEAAAIVKSTGENAAGDAASASANAPSGTAPAAVLSTPSDGSGTTGMAVGIPAPAPPSQARGHVKHHGGKATTSAAPSSDGAMAIAIDAINIQDGSANYSDFWIQPHFAVGIQGLHGSVLGLSSGPRARAKVELQGKVDRYAPAHIWGQTNPLAATTYTDIKMSFKGVELTSATPYSGHFAGYKIEKGKLSVDIEYKIENRKLTAAHKFVIEQLELGDRVESPDAVHLPLKIAVALLKDRNGVIDVDLPVTGSLDDPQFKLGPLIWKAVRSLLVKVATAPFALLGHLFGGGEQMNFIDFHPGSATLDAPEHDKLVSLVKALKEKEKLELDIPITFSPDLDRPALAAARLNERLLALQEEQSAGRKHGKDSGKTNTTSQAPGTASAAAPQPAADPPPLDPALTDPAQRYHLLVALYRAEMGKDTPLPDAARAVEAARKQDPPPDYNAANRELEAALLQKMPVADTDLETLGKRRARAIQDVLLLGTDIDPSRVFVIGNAPKTSPEKDKVRVELALK